MASKSTNCFETQPLFLCFSRGCRMINSSACPPPSLLTFLSRLVNSFLRVGWELVPNSPLAWALYLITHRGSVLKETLGEWFLKIYTYLFQTRGLLEAVLAGPWTLIISGWDWGAISKGKSTLTFLGPPAPRGWTSFPAVSASWWACPIDLPGLQRIALLCWGPYNSIYGSFIRFGRCFKWGRKEAARFTWSFSSGNKVEECIQSFFLHKGCKNSSGTTEKSHLYLKPRFLKH